METLDPEIKSKIEQSIFKGNLALGGNQFEKAALFFEEAYELLKGADQSTGEQAKQCLKNLCECNAKLERNELALKYIKALRKLYDCTEYRRVYIVLLSKIAESYIKDGDRDASEEAYKDALEQASYLLPKNDPLIAQLNKDCLEILKRTIKSRKIIASDERMVHAEVAAPEPEEKEEAPVPVAPFSVHKSVPEKKGKFGDLKIFSRKNLSLALQSNVLTIVVSIMLLACLARAACFMPDYNMVKNTADAAAQLQGTQFQSADNQTSFCLTDAKACQIRTPQLNVLCHYKIVGNDLQQIWSLFVGHLKRRELWYQIAPGGIIDPDKTMLYTEKSPEHFIAEKMWWYADFAQKWYQTNHVYPDSAVRCLRKDSQFKYINPVTFKDDEAAIITLRGLPDDPSWSVRTKNVKASPFWRPAGIYCLRLDSTKFYIHGFDREGRPLTSSDPLHYFVIKCLDGRTVSAAAAVTTGLPGSSANDNNGQAATSDSSLFVYVCSKPEQENTVRYFRSLSCASCWLALILALLWCWSTFRLKKSRIVKGLGLVFTLAAVAALACWYMLALG